MAPRDAPPKTGIPDFHRDSTLDEEGVSQVVVERFIDYRLPFLLKVKDEVDAGRELDDGELARLSRIVDDIEDIGRFVYEHPQFEELAAKIVGLVGEITDGAVRNAKDATRR